MKRVIFGLFAAVCLALCGCNAASPVLVPERTLSPTPPPATPSPTPQPTPTPLPTPELGAAVRVYDDMGAKIEGADHYKRYITFGGIQVYEQCEDTFMDAIAFNRYSRPLVCALSIVFYEEKAGEGEPVAQGRVQTRDGQYVLVLEPGETTLFAQIDTDMRLTDLPFELVFDDALGVKPQDE